MPYDLNTISGIGAGQFLMGLTTQTGKRPKYNVPGAMEEALTNARMMNFSSTRPGNDYALDQISRAEGRSLASINRNATSASQVLAAAQGINQNTQQAVQANNAQNSQFKFNAFQNLQGVLQNFARYQDKAWLENMYKPYMDAVNTKASLIGSGLQNMVNGQQQAQSNKQQQQYLNYLMGNQTPDTQSTGLFGGLFNNWFGRYKPPASWQQNVGYSGYDPQPELGLN